MLQVPARTVKYTKLCLVKPMQFGLGSEAEEEEQEEEEEEEEEEEDEEEDEQEEEEEDEDEEEESQGNVGGVLVINNLPARSRQSALCVSRKPRTRPINAAALASRSFMGPIARSSNSAACASSSAAA